MRKDCSNSLNCFGPVSVDRAQGENALGLGQCHLHHDQLLVFLLSLHSVARFSSSSSSSSAAWKSCASSLSTSSSSHGSGCRSAERFPLASAGLLPGEDETPRPGSRKSAARPCHGALLLVKLAERVAWPSHRHWPQSGPAQVDLVAFGEPHLSVHGLCNVPSALSRHRTFERPVPSQIERLQVRPLV